MYHKNNQPQKKTLLLTKFGRDLIDKNVDIIFLNERCLSCNEIVEKSVDFMAYPYHEDHLVVLEKYEKKIFDDAITLIAPILSEINNVKYGKEYWKYYTAIEVGVLFWSYYSMYSQIINALKEYPDIRIVCFEDDKYDIAQLNITSYQFQAYMQQLIGKQILVSLNYHNLQVEKIKLADFYETNIDHQTVAKTHLGIRVILRKGYDWIYKTISKRTNAIITYSFSNNIRNLQRELLGKAFFCTEKMSTYLDKYVDIQKRKNLIASVSAGTFEDEFEKIFIHNIGYNLSLNYLENYRKICKETKSVKKMNFKTYIKFLNTPELLEYAAYIKENGGKIVECSHSIEEGWRVWKTLSMKNADYFFAWSKKEYLSYDNYMECISYMLNTVKNVNYMDNTNILYARGAETSPYVTTVFDIVVAQRIKLQETVLRPVKFYNELDTSIQECMQYRNRDDWGEGSRECVERYCSNIQFDDSFENGRYQSFAEQIQKARIVVVESIHSTSFFQAILFGVPTIIIENLDYRGLLNNEILDLLEELKTIDVWFEDASKAGKVINENYEKIDEWWNMTERRNVIQKIQNLWGRLDGKSESDWWKETLAKLI